jgi:beta-galactosidase
MRWAAWVVACGLLWLGAVPASQGRSEPFVPVGVWYGGGTVRPPATSRNPAAERDRWRADLQAIRALGFNSVRSWVSWADLEPVRSQFRFEALDQILRLAQDAGLKVAVQLYAEPAPDWVRRAYPDALVTPSPKGGSATSAPAVCPDHPGVREALRGFVAAASARAARAGSFHAIDVWSEPVAFVNAGPPDGCFCAHTARRFREWLQHKYGSIDALNAAWSRTFGDWPEVNAPRGAPSASRPDAIDWNTFLGVRRQEDLQLLAGASATRGPHPTTAHSRVPSILRVPFDPAADDWWLSGAVDAYGTAIHPQPVGASWPAHHLAAGLDGIRSAGRDRGWLASALQGGQSVEGAAVAPPVSPEDLRLWSWAVLSRGARAIFYDAWLPRSAGFDAGGYGLVDLDGTITDRARTAGAFAAILTRNPALFAPLRPRPSRIAILYTPSSSILGGNPYGPRPRDSLLGIYRALFERNIQADFVHADEIVAGRASAYRAIILPAPLVLPEPVAAALTAYVRAGGTLVSEASPARRDERGRANAKVPGFGLDGLFGARARELRPVTRVDMIVERELDGPLSALAGRRVQGSGYAESLEISGSNVRVIARFPGRDGAPGDPAIVMGRHSDGRAILIGSLPGAAIEADPGGSGPAADLLAALASSAGIQPDVRVSGATAPIETRFLESSEATVLVAINYADTPQKATLTFPPDTPEAIWLNLETGASINFVAGPDGPTYTHSFAPRDVVVLMIKKEYR